jgi:hypothetical protein
VNYRLNTNTSNIIRKQVMLKGGQKWEREGKRRKLRR